MSKIDSLRKLLITNDLDFYVVPKNDQYFQEYSNPDRLRYISNFNGSAGIAFVGREKNYLFVDGRYTIQAEIETGKEFKIFDISKLSLKEFSKKFLRNKKIGFDPNLFTKKFLINNISEVCDLIPLYQNLIDKIINNKKNKKESFFFPLYKKISGENHIRKIIRICEHLRFLILNRHRFLCRYNVVHHNHLNVVFRIFSLF